MLHRENNNCKSFNDAEIVIGVGRGVKNEQEKEFINELAAYLGGVVAGSRAVVEMGLVAPEFQIGQTGHTSRLNYILRAE